MFYKISFIYISLILLFTTYTFNVYGATTVIYSPQAPSSTKVADTNCQEFTNYTCNNGPAPGNSGGCGTACDGGNAWEKHEYSGCYADPDSPGDYVAWVPYTEDVCSTADKYNDRYSGGDLTMLRFGNCSCSTGSLYKTCCNGTNPINTYNYTTATGQGNPDFPDGGCAYTTIRCGAGTSYTCGQNACNSLATPTPVPTISPTPTPGCTIIESSCGTCSTATCTQHCLNTCNQVITRVCSQSCGVSPTPTPVCNPGRTQVLCSTSTCSL